MSVKVEIKSMGTNIATSMGTNMGTNIGTSMGTSMGTNCSAEMEELTNARSLDNIRRLQSGTDSMTGWVGYPLNISEELIDDIEKTAEVLRNQCTLMVVVGIGGSYLGAKSVNDALNGSMPGYPQVVFAGYSMSAAYVSRIIERMKNEACCLCVISKSGRTVEPLLVYHILRDVLYSKYGSEEAARRIYVVTDKNGGRLVEDAGRFGYKTFEVPEDVSGRYSVLTPVGLLPIAAAGHDIRKLIEGAGACARCEDFGPVLRYVMFRNLLQTQGKGVEVFEYFEANMKYFGDWLKQLFAESEGKEGKGSFPTSLCFSRDLHSVGQFLQEGRQIFFETMIRIEKPACDFVIPEDAGEPFAGKTLEQINNCSEEGVIRAHSKAGIPVIVISVPELSEYCLGELIYFFEMSCAVSAMNNGVNPFDQPGVDAYKNEMLKLVKQL